MEQVTGFWEEKEADTANRDSKQAIGAGLDMEAAFGTSNTGCGFVWGGGVRGERGEETDTANRDSNQANDIRLTIV